jgi:sporulation protein YlmC with PRC-barrel domain
MTKRLQLDLLVGRRVYDAEWRKLGRVDEILLAREGDHYAVEGLLIGVNGLAERLGVARHLKRIERRLKLRTWRVEDHIVYWDQIASIEEQCIRLRISKQEVQTLSLNE